MEVNEDFHEIFVLGELHLEGADGFRNQFSILNDSFENGFEFSFDPGMGVHWGGVHGNRKFVDFSPLRSFRLLLSRDLAHGNERFDGLD
jgi:hypothetical protein